MPMLPQPTCGRAGIAGARSHGRDTRRSVFGPLQSRLPTHFNGGSTRPWNGGRTKGREEYTGRGMVDTCRRSKSEARMLG